jgi:hypothetical protein
MARCPAEAVLQDHSGRLPVETLLACACVSPHWRTLATAALEQRHELRLSDDFNVERQTMALVQVRACWDAGTRIGLSFRLCSALPVKHTNRLAAERRNG